MASKKDLTTGSIMNHIKNISIPASTGLIFTTLYNATDTYFAGQLVGTTALAGITLSFPIYFIINAISNGLGSGTTALLSISIGKRDDEKYHSLVINSFFLGIISSIILLFLGPLSIDFLLELGGGSGETLVEAHKYLKPMFIASFFFIANSILNGILNSQGDTKSYRNFLIIGFFLNIVLDSLFITGIFGLPKLGTTGVSLATVLIMVFGTIYLSKKVFNSSEISKVLLKKQRLVKLHISEILSQSIPASLNTATTAIGVFVINYLILKLSSGPSVIAAYGAAMRIEQFILVPTFGLNTAAVTIVGQNYGAQNYDRIRELERKIIMVGMIMVCSLVIIIYPFKAKLIGIFNSDISVIEAGVKYLRIALFVEPTYIIMGLYTSMLQGVKKPHFAVFLGLYRQLIMPFLLITFLVSVFDMGISAVWWSIFVVNWSATLLTIFYTRRVLKKLLV